MFYSDSSLDLYTTWKARNKNDRNTPKNDKNDNKNDTKNTTDDTPLNVTLK
jgi:hypothetical protein